MKHSILGLALVAAIGATQPAGAALLSYPGFAATTGLSVNLDAARATDASGRAVLRLTPARQWQGGSVFTSSTLNLAQGFSTRFTFNVNGNDPNYNGADGLVFVVQGSSSGVGGRGGGMGYAGVQRSLGVEFDTYDNGGDDRNSGNHVGIDTNGDLNSRVVDTALPFVLDGGRDVTAWVDYDPALKQLAVRYAAGGPGTIRPTAANLSYAVDLATLLGRPDAYVGFTSATGGGYSNHDLVDWSFRNGPAASAGAVPEPATWAMMVAGFGLVGAAARRRRGVAAAA